MADMYECKTTNPNAWFLTGRARALRQGRPDETDRDRADAYERAARDLDARTADDAECRKMIHEARGVSDDRDFDTPFELGGMIAEFKAEIERLTSAEAEARAEVDRLRGAMLTHAAHLVRLRYTAHTCYAAERIKTNRLVMEAAIERDEDVQRRAGIALRDAMHADKMPEGKSK